MSDSQVDVSADVSSQSDQNQEQAPEVNLSANQKVDQIHSLLTPFMDAVAGALSRSEATAKDVINHLEKYEQRLNDMYAHLQKAVPAVEAPVAPEAPADENVPSADVPAPDQAPADEVAPATEQPMPQAPVEAPANPEAVPTEDRPEVRSDATTVDPVHTEEAIEKA